MLLHYNKGLVGQFVWRCKRMGTDCAFGELVLAGEEALYKAAIKWDAKRGTRFSTYAFQRVNRAIVGYIMEHEDVIKIPVNLKELQNKIRAAQAKLSQVIVHLRHKVLYNAHHQCHDAQNHKKKHSCLLWTRVKNCRLQELQTCVV